jgi:multiple sugar transport system permease protein
VFIFRNAISSGQLGYGAAISTVVLGVNLVIAQFYQRLLRERT